MLQRMLTEIRIAGFGGQGVILAASVIGKAAAIFEGGFATMTQSFGPEARGQEAYTRFSPQLKPGGILITEQDLVRVDHVPENIQVYGVPATRLAEELGRKVVLNIVMVGFFGAVTNLLDADALRKAVEDSVPPALAKLNLQAFDKGFAFGTELVHKLAENGDCESVAALESV